MRITESQLRKIIAEEISSLVENPTAGGQEVSDPKVEDDEIAALKMLLIKLDSDVATKVINAVKKDSELSSELSTADYQALGKTFLGILKAKDTQTIAAMKTLVNKIAT